MSSYSRQQLEDWVKEIPVDGKIIDVGGSQLPIKGRLKNIGEGSEFKIIDLINPHEVKSNPDYVADLNYYMPFDSEYEGEKDVFRFEDKSFCKRRSFDHAFCLEVSEYWWNPVQALKNINLMLKDGGLLHISFHFIYPVHNPPGEDLMRYTPDGVITLLKKLGFDPMFIPRLISDEGHSVIRDFYSVEGMRPSKEYPNHNWQGALITAKKIKDIDKLEPEDYKRF